MNANSGSGARVHPLRARLKEVVGRTILEAAEQVFSERGLDARLEEVASSAGVAVGTLYNHFSDRQALVEALLESHRCNLRERLQAVAIRVKELSFREQLEAILTEIVAVSLPKLRLRMLLLQTHPQRTARHAEMRQRLSLVLGPLFEKARQKGELASDPEGVHFPLLLGMTHAMLTATQESPPLLSP